MTICFFIPFFIPSSLERSLPTFLTMYPGLTTSRPSSQTIGPFLVEVNSTRRGVSCTQSPPSRLDPVFPRMLFADADFSVCASGLICYNSFPVCSQAAPTWSKTHLQRRNSPWCPCPFRPFCRIHLLGTKHGQLPFSLGCLIGNSPAKDLSPFGRSCYCWTYKWDMTM